MPINRPTFFYWLYWRMALWGLIGLQLSVAYGQNFCTLPPANTATGGFTLNQLTICQGSTINVTAEVPGLSQITYDFRYGGAGIPGGSTVRQYTYPQSGQYTIVQQGYLGRLSTLNCQQVTVLTTDPMAFSATVCQNRFVSLHPLPDNRTASYNQLLVDWGDGTIETLSLSAPLLSHTYRQDGTYSITMNGKHRSLPACEGKKVQQTVQVVPIPDQTLYISDLQSTTRGLVNLTVAGSSALPYELWRGDTNQPLQPTNRYYLSGVTDSLPVPSTGSICFQLRRTDGCGQLIQSDIACTIVPSVVASSQQNTVSWQAYAGSGKFEQWKLSRNGQPVTLPNATDPKTARWDDRTSIECGELYCYSLSTTVGKTRISSSPVCERGIDTRPPTTPDPVLVSVETPTLVSIQTLLPQVSSGTSFTLTISRFDSVQGGMLPLASLSKGFSYSDNTVNSVQRSYCYTLSLTNRCGLTSVVSQPACTIWLSSTSPTKLQWSEQSPFGINPVKTYIVQVYQRNTGQLVREVDVGSVFTYAPDLNDPASLDYEYRIIAVGDGSIKSYSNFCTLTTRMRLFIPDAFSPNGDQVNDTFEIKGIGAGIKTYQLLIYNRWGTPVFQTTDQQRNWDGTIDGQPAPDGQYIYSITLTTQADQVQTYQGKVLVIR
jgi:gliding motility-associated-like protein